MPAIPPAPRRDARLLARLHGAPPPARAARRGDGALGAALESAQLRALGALIAAPTTSLPDRRGGQRNWDYRYAWLHDAGFTLWALDGIGATDEAQALFGWLRGVARGRHPATLHALYGVRGETEPAERELYHLSGYLGARPVRIGNAASSELELDVFGELIDAVHTFGARFGVHDDLRTCRAVVDWVAHHWRNPDQGLWEERSRRRAFVYSKAARWLALDRGLRCFPARRRRSIGGASAPPSMMMCGAWLRVSERAGAGLRQSRARRLGAAAALIGFFPPAIRAWSPPSSRFTGG